MPCAASWKPRWRASSRPAPARPTSAASRPTWPGNARRWSGDAQARNRLLGDFHLLLAEIVGNQVLTDMLRELLARSAVITAVPEHARRRLFLARAPCLHPGRAQGRRRRRQRPDGRTPAPCAGRPGFPGRRARRRRPGHRAVALTRRPLVRLIQRRRGAGKPIQCYMQPASAGCRVRRPRAASAARPQQPHACRETPYVQTHPDPHRRVRPVQ